jgi:meso-butanediol dehydrogenase / (S,S)-butanediol dehydrogenase / diacetyl reductase
MTGQAEQRMYRLDGKTALVTGAALGIGRAIAVRLAQEGADLMLFDINEAQAERTARMVLGAGRRCVVVGGDVGDYAQVKGAVDDCVRRFGAIDIVVNNAGISPMATIAETSPEEFRNVFRVNVDGVFHGCKSVAPHMTARGSGKIINISSWFGKIGQHSFGAYCASKFAVIGLTQSMAKEMAEHGVNVNAVCPGTIVDTGMREEADREAIRLGRRTAKEREANIPLGRVGVPEDISRVVAFLASEESDYMTGQAINVTGGLLMH